MKTEVELNGKTILVTGAAGFIGANLAERLTKETCGSRIVGMDDLNDYYDPGLKRYRLRQIEAAASANGAEWSFEKESIADAEAVRTIFERYRPDVVVNLAAQAGVRYSVEHPDAYIQSNMIGFYQILEACRRSAGKVEHLVYASSSSVYGGNSRLPFSVGDRTDAPCSLYAATKKSNELFACSYSGLYGIPSTGLRFFTVYGPAGRPDMFLFGAVSKLLAGETVQIYNYGSCKRDFTYIDDITEGILRVMRKAPARSAGTDGLPAAPHALYNIGHGRPEKLTDFIDVMQEELVRAGLLPKDHDFEAQKQYVGMQPGDMPVTWADTSALERDFGYCPKTGIREGVRRFVEWYAQYYGSQKERRDDIQ